LERLPLQAHNTATERALSARMLPQDLLRAWPFYNSYCFDAVYLLSEEILADLPWGGVFSETKIHKRKFSFVINQLCELGVHFR
jgi:hypothetical protein